jgi:hypothetical protein
MVVHARINGNCDSHKRIGVKVMHTYENAKNAQERKAVLNQIFAIWEKHPEYRVGQLLSNALTKDLFFICDSDLLSDLKEQERLNATQKQLYGNGR